MHSRAKSLVLILTILMVGAAQVFGFQRGYFCGCTGIESSAESCVKEAAASDCGEHASPAADHEGEQNSDHQPCKKPHQQMRESLVAAGSVAQLTLPPLTVMDILPALLESLLAVPVSEEENILGVERSDSDRSPPTCLIVAETEVILV